MFPSLGLLAQIDCPFREQCHRGSTCLFKHKPSHSIKHAQQQLNSIQQRDMAMKEEILLEDTVAQPQTSSKNNPVAVRAAVTREPITPWPSSEFKPKPTYTEHVSQRLDEKERAADSAKSAASDKAGQWRGLTLNYDSAGPAYDPATEEQAKVPQLKAVVGDKVGYARRQRALETIYKYSMQIHQGAEPWVPAKHAVLEEAELYATSVGGTYHGKLLTCLKSLKQQAKK
ncbi:hypothetical protein IWW36_001023 [Coemansia brasiliensis]|uniref:C3H1-type domain-containing protein n=1 Tax=Coemansia brasiliensis TaxID=2650707 RepID=A0A9W8IEP9_9FUNG|nr:hypothetical protein IWW36_001023 [Coemansia brasiliensis]